MELKRFKQILNNVRDMKHRMSEMIGRYKKEVEMKEKNPNFKPTSFLSIVSSQCPDYLKGKSSEWVGFVSTYITLYKETFALKVSMNTLLQMKEQLELNFNTKTN